VPNILLVEDNEMNAAEIVETEYFQQLQQKARTLRQKPEG
jgi:hypothetical protein